MSAAVQNEALAKALAGLRLGYPAHWHASIGSTNDEAKRLADGGAPEGLLVLAERQSAGRGRAGRRWLTNPGTALAFSVLLRPVLEAGQAGLLMMLAGTAVCAAIEQATGLAPQLKWPNDILLGGKKAGGILVEASLDGGRMDYAVVGIGLNVSEAPLAVEVDFPATALQTETGRRIDRFELLRGIVQELEGRYAGLAPGRAGELYGAWRKRLAWLGEAVVVETAQGDVSGRLVDTEADGSVVVELESSGRQTLAAGTLRTAKREGG